MRSITGFPADFHFIRDGQEFWPIGTEPSLTRDGREVVLVRWATQCPTCGVGFTITTTTAVEYFRRRCDVCKRPGRSVKAERKAAQRVSRH